jgi:hypothetical protein
MQRLPRCQDCRAAPAEWAIQYLAEERPTVALLGWHTRGFPARKCCTACKEARKQAYHGARQRGDDDVRS